ncbi:hypothetical protein [Perigonia lusca single nucleopolyhedrovirus]|uniref:Uncharacterized protein n=1 Tax=Perigonia lusca single nucleopolyhedrovirus TaxID=1675865 RepID=A0A0M3N123_9ABAC|nr:hypothetical protein [Perigonia lusca single nucleopolyhedrovirus]AKN80633.1 hypothetical protein [Perigonia lusca single nucleopolyhedrovirus]
MTLSVSETIPATLTKLNINFSRHVDHTDNVIRCDHCAFVAPMSIQFEEYIKLHDMFNEIIEDNDNNNNNDERREAKQITLNLQN